MAIYCRRPNLNLGVAITMSTNLEEKKTSFEIKPNITNIQMNF